MPLNETIISNLKQIRLDRKMTIQQFADLLQVERTTYGKMEKGNRDLSLNTIEHFAERLGIPVSNLLGSSIYNQENTHFEQSTFCVHGVNTTLSVNIPTEVLEALMNKLDSLKRTDQ